MSLKRKKAPKPPPLDVKLTKAPVQWVRQKAETLLHKGLGVHFGTLIVVALYYIFLGWDSTPLNGLWHWVIQDSDLRHMVRGVGEGILGGVLGQVLAFNAYKRVIKKTNWLDRLEIKLRIPNLKDKRRLSGLQLAMAPLTILLYALPGFFAAYLALKGVHHNILSQPHASGNSYVDQVKQIWTSEKDQKLVGLFASVFMARRPIKKIANDIQLWFVEQRILGGKAPKWWHGPTYEARYHDVQSGGVKKSSISHEGWVAKAMTGALLVGLALAGFGYYILTEIAG